MLMIVGLGNPGPRYAGHRHNIGFMAIDEIARDPAFGPFSRKFSAEIAEGQIGGEKVFLLKPQTYMNDSGRSVGEAARFFKIDAGDILAIHDELDLPPGKLRMKTGGGHGGHNGLKSIDAHLGTRDYRRMRLGIGHPGSKEAVTPHVLGDFAKADRVWLDPLLEAIGRHAESLTAREDAVFMNRIAMATQGSEPAGAKGAKAAAGERKPARGQSHVRQARTGGPQAALPEKGPMADILKKMFGGKD